MTPRQRLELFLLDADRLRDTPELGSNFGSRLELKWGQGQPMTMTSVEPSADDLDVLLMRLRPFLLQGAGDLTNLRRIYDECERHLRSDELRGYLRAARADWKQAQRTGAFGLAIDGHDITPEHAAELVLYGSGLFHRTKWTEWQELGQPGQLLTKHAALGYITDAVEHVLHAAIVVREALSQGLVD